MQLEQKELEALAVRTGRSPPEFCRIFLPDMFPRKMPWVHRGLFALLQQKTDFLLDFGKEQWRDEEAEWTTADLEKILSNFIEEGTGRHIFELVFDEDGQPKILIHCRQHICVIMPRGSSKTTIVNASNLMDLLFQREDFFLYVSESGAHAERQLGTIKAELEDYDGVPGNELLYHVFGLHKPGRQSPLKWTENYIETLKGVMVGAVGRGGQIRGFGKRGKRPGKIVFDDLEDEESVASDVQRAKDNKWFWNSARPAKRKHTGRDVLIGTLLHTDAILNKAIVSREFTAVRFGAVDRQGDALWEWWMSLEDIEQAKLAAAEVGELMGFYLEYMSEYKDDAARVFPESKLIYVHKGMELFAALALACDPAISENKLAAMCAFAVAGIEKGGHKHILDSYGEKGMDSADLLDKFFELHFTWFRNFPPELQRHGIEAVAYQQALIPMVRARQVQESKKYGQAAYFEITPIRHGKIAKYTRVKGIMKPLVYAGQLTFERRDPDMHTQLIGFGAKGSLVDLPDVAAMAVALLDPYVMLGIEEPGEAANTNLEEDKAPPLRLVIGDKWRQAP